MLSVQHTLVHPSSLNLMPPLCEASPTPPSSHPSASSLARYVEVIGYHGIQQADGRGKAAFMSVLAKLSSEALP